MRVELKNKFSKLERERKELISEIEQLNNRQINFKPEKNKWSILQILFHIVKAEHLTIISIKNSLNKKDDLDSSTTGAVVRSFLLNLSLKFPMKIKAPQILRKVPDTHDTEQLIKKWITLRKDLYKIIEENSDYQILKKYVFRHPYAGRLNFVQAMEFLENHLKHHKRQIIKLKNRSKPKI